MKILVTAGPTREFLDSVRFLSNPSSGRMGYAIAAEAVRRGHDVALVSGPVELSVLEDVVTTHVVSAAEMFDSAVKAFADCAAAVMTAAVADYSPVDRSPRKRAKSDAGLTLQLVPTRDICAHLGKIKGERVVVGFAMDDHHAHEHAQTKLRRKQCDAIVLNGPDNIGGNQARVEILRAKGGWCPPRSGTKAEIASVVLDLVEELVPAASSGG